MCSIDGVISVIFEDRKFPSVDSSVECFAITLPRAAPCDIPGCLPDLIAYMSLGGQMNARDTQESSIFTKRIGAKTQECRTIS
jgi:hypothetical protein